ncbi:hypothetical protein FG386_001961 [Cryptosporidium ryanae]|uniref:uncharacterized protein n=1 Tax=Cryptosporidium ryanae TaxID=515981 RepID=UPI00351AA5AD|nr:hypothetical protein FG386_001961 [Cryptosporidium ryanae]
MIKLRSTFRRSQEGVKIQDVFRRIKNETELSHKQIKNFHSTFKANSDNGVMNINKFRILLGLLNDGLLSQMIFNAMDLNNDRVLDFYEFGRSLGIMISNNFDEKAKFSLRVILGNEFESIESGITLQRLITSIRAIDNARYTLVGPHILTFSDQEIKYFFDCYSTLRENEQEKKIYFEEYKSAIQESPEFLSFFGIITSGMLELPEFDSECGSFSIFDASKYLRKAIEENVEANEMSERGELNELKVQTYTLLEDIKNVKQEIKNSLNTLDAFIVSATQDKELTLVYSGNHGSNSNTCFSEKQGRFVNQKKPFGSLIDQLLSLKVSLEDNVEVFDSIYKKNLNNMHCKTHIHSIIGKKNVQDSSVKRMQNRKKMYINKGNVAPNVKRMSATEIIKKTFLHKTSSKFESSSFNYNPNKRKRRSIIDIYRKKGRISSGYHGNTSRSSNSVDLSVAKPKASVHKKKSNTSKDKDSLSTRSVKLSSVPRMKGYVVYIGHESWNNVLNMMVGMRLAIGRVYSEPNRQVADYDFIMKEKFFIIPRTSNSLHTKQNLMLQKSNDSRSYSKPVQFIDYNPMVFRKIREICKISPESYIRSVGPEQLLGNMVLGNLSSMNELCSEGKSGAFFYYTTDGRFVIKTVEKKTVLFFRSILNKYYSHIENNPNSLITRIYGLHALRLKKPLFKSINSLRCQVSDNHPSIMTKNKIHKIFFIVMENIFHTPVEINRRYDIKGSLIGRSTPLILQSDKTIALKELDMRHNGEMLSIDEEMQKSLLSQLESDCRFFEFYNIMDYSLLIGIHDVESDVQDIKSIIENNCERKFVGILSKDHKKVYYLGFIDFFSTWNTVKKFERMYKTITIGTSTKISAVPPSLYASRFLKFIKSRIC